MNKKRLSVFFLAMINVAVIMSLRGLPMMAKEGYSLSLPSQLSIGSPLFYVLFLTVGTLVFLGTPILMIHFRKPSWKLKNDNKEK